MCVCLHGEATPKVVRRMGGRGGDARVSHSLAHAEWAGMGMGVRERGEGEMRRREKEGAMGDVRGWGMGWRGWVGESEVSGDEG